MKSTGRARPLVLMLVLSACAVYEGQKIDAEGNLGTAEGIPYLLPRSEYLLKRDASANPPRYTVQVNHVPDPTQRYTLRLDPAVTSAVTFNLDLGTAGELTSVTGDRKDQIVPTIKSLFSFVLSTLGAVAKVLPVRQSLELQDREGAAIIPEADGMVSCADKKTPARVVHCVIMLAACPQAPKQQLLQRIENDYFGRELASEETGEPEVEPDKADVIASLHYLDLGERQCMIDAAQNLTKLTEQIESEMLKGLNAHLPGDGGDTGTFKAKVVQLINTSDAAGTKRLVQALKEALQSESDDRYLLLRRELGAPVSPPDETLEAWRQALVALLLWGDQKEILPASPIEAMVRARRVAVGLQAIADLEVDRWRGRHIAYLDRRIAERALTLLTGDPRLDPEEDEEIEDRREEIAVTAYKSPEYERLRRLLPALDALPPEPPSERISPFEEYGRLRAEAERLEAEIARTAETLVAAAKAVKSEVAAALPLHVPRVPAVCISESREPGWFHGKGAPAPEFVIVLERPGAVAAAKSTGVGKCPWPEFW